MSNKERTTELKNNEQWNLVAEMLGLKGHSFFGGIERCDFSVFQLNTILEMGFISPGYRFNNSPTVKTFFEFGKRAEAYGATVVYEGFLESKNRKGALLLIEGVRVTNFSDSVSLILDFSQTFHTADEFTANHELLRAWYD